MLPLTHANQRRSVELSDAILTLLSDRGETSLVDIADAVGSSSDALAQSRMLYNLRLSIERHPHRIRSRYIRRRTHWSLIPAPNHHP